MKIVRLHDLSKVRASHEDPKNTGVLKQILYRRDDLTSGRIQMVNWATLLPGKSFSEHQHEDMDEIFIMLHGKVEITIGNEREILEKGDTVVVPEASVHSMKNLTDKEVLFIAMGVVRDQK